jgi:hypothetical protein
MISFSPFSVAIILVLFSVTLVECCLDCIDTLACAAGATVSCDCFYKINSCIALECPSANETIAAYQQICNQANCTDCAKPVKPLFTVTRVWPHNITCDSTPPFAVVVAPEASFDCENLPCKLFDGVHFSRTCVETKPTSFPNHPIKLFSCNEDHVVQYDRGYTFFTKPQQGNQNCVFPAIEGVPWMKIDCERKLYDVSCNDGCTECSDDLRSFDNDNCARLTSFDSQFYRIVCPIVPSTPATSPTTNENDASIANHHRQRQLQLRCR